MNKVILCNGSPKIEGNTAYALGVVASELSKAGIECINVHVGSLLIHGCKACGRCKATKNNRCILEQDQVNDWIELIRTADGIIIGSPVYFGGITAPQKAFLDLAFYVAQANNACFRHKIGASVIVARRAGEVMAQHQIANYYLLSEMHMPSSNYWNIMFGSQPGDARLDQEGIQTLRVLGKNFAWLVQSTKDYSELNLIPEHEPKIRSGHY